MKKKIEIWKSRDEWEYKYVCNSPWFTGCITPNNESGLCEKHYRKWQRRKRIWNWLKSLFMKFDESGEITQIGFWPIKPKSNEIIPEYDFENKPPQSITCD